MYIYNYYDECHVFFAQVQLTCVQSCISIFQHADVSTATPLIHAVTPCVVRHLLPNVDDVTTQSEADVTASSVESEADVMLWLEEVRLLETLIAMTSDDKRE